MMPGRPSGDGRGEQGGEPRQPRGKRRTCITTGTRRAQTQHDGSPKASRGAPVGAPVEPIVVRKHKLRIFTSGYRRKSSRVTNALPGHRATPRRVSWSSSRVGGTSDVCSALAATSARARMLWACVVYHYLSDWFMVCDAAGASGRQTNDQSTEGSDDSPG